MRNGQNEVVSLMDNSGAVVVSYSYDAWGKPLATTGTLATTLGADNPFRYRGYYYDTETGLYYLQSRYYDPDTCRFLNGDVLMSTGQGVIGYNMYAYCNNNPAAFTDSEGTEAIPVQQVPGFIETIGAALGAIGAALGVSTGTIVIVAIVVAIALSVAVGVEAYQQRSIARAREKEKVQEKDITNAAPPSKPYQYWQATIVNKEVVPIKGLEYSQARAWVEKGGDLLCINHAAAIAIVKFYPTAVWDPKHGEGYLNHYHLSAAHTNHIWYYGE